MIAWFRRRLARDAGFTLVELTVAMVITMLVVSSLLVVFLGSIRSIALAKQRQAATALATATMEQFRALDYGTLSAGLYCSDVTGDANITVSGTCGGGGTVTFAPAGTGISETVKVQTGTPAGNVPPIYPHVTTKRVENATYTVKSYLTVSPTTPAAFNLTVFVSWSSSVSKGTKSVAQRSTEFSPSRCLSSATHPYSGACQAAFNGDAGTSNAVISITNVSGNGGDIPGFDGKSMQLALGQLSSTLAVEQITKLTGKVQTTSASAVSDSGTSTTGGNIATVAADSDPSSTTGGAQTASTSQSGTTSVSLTGDAGTLSGSPTSGGSASLDAEVSSTSTSCLDGTGAILAAIQRPCSWGTRQSSGSAGNLSLLLANWGSNFGLVSVGPSAAPARASVAVIPASGGTACPSATGAGCVTAQSSRSLGTIKIGGLPSAGSGDSPPVGWTGSLITLSGVAESAYSESGIGARTPPVFTRSAGTLSYYDAATQSMKTLDLTSLTSDTTVSLAPVSGTYYQGGHREDLQISASFTAGASTAGSTSAVDPACKTQACTASATPSSTLIATLVYTISRDGNPATSFAVAVDLGACVARTSYTAAFDA